MTLMMVVCVGHFNCRPRACYSDCFFEPELRLAMEVVGYHGSESAPHGRHPALVTKRVSLMQVAMKKPQCQDYASIGQDKAL